MSPEPQGITTDLASPAVPFQAKPSQDWETFLGEQSQEPRRGHQKGPSKPSLLFFLKELWVGEGRTHEIQESQGAAGGGGVGTRFT